MLAIGPPPIPPGPRRRVDRRGQPRHPRRRQGRRPGRWRREPGQPRGPVVPAGTTPRPGAEPHPRGGPPGPRPRPAPVPVLVLRPHLRRPRLDPRPLGERPGDRPRPRPPAPVLLRPGLREGHRALEAGAGRPRDPGRRGGRADHVRAHDRPPRGRGAGDVRDLQLRPGGPGVAAQPRLLGERALFRGRPGRGEVHRRGPVVEHERPARVPPPGRGRPRPDRADRDPRARGEGPARPPS